MCNSKLLDKLEAGRLHQYSMLRGRRLGKYGVLQWFLFNGIIVQTFLGVFYENIAAYLLRTLCEPVH